MAGIRLATEEEKAKGGPSGVAENAPQGTVYAEVTERIDELKAKKTQAQAIT